MPSLPRLKRPREAVASAAPAAVPEAKGPRVEEITSNGLRWFNVEQPGSLEQAWLQEHFSFHALDLEDVLSRNQRPKIDEYPNYIFLVIHIPVFNSKVGRLGAGELDMFVGPDFVVTLPNEQLPPVEYLFGRCQSDSEFREAIFARGAGYLMYRLVDDSFDYCFPMLRKISNKLDGLEDEIFEGHSDDVVRDISNLKQEIINFRKVIRPQRTVLVDLEKVKERYLTEEIDLEIYFDDIADAHERIWDLLENYKEVVVGLEETNESILSHRSMERLNVLTAITVIVLPLTLIASIFGMNVGLPGGGDPQTSGLTTFLSVIGVMVAIGVAMFGFFRIRRWL